MLFFGIDLFSRLKWPIINDFQGNGAIKEKFIMKSHNYDFQRLKEHLLQILEKFPLGISEYDMIKELSLRTDMIAADFGKDNLNLFKTHFVLFNGLFRLQQLLAEEGNRYLEIGVMNIRLRESIEGGDEKSLDNGGSAKLAAYYLDMMNLDEMTRDGVDEMISTFWASFNGEPERKKALTVLGLEEGISFSEVRKRYRKLARDHHPDRGGDKERLQEINDAMEILKRYNVHK